MTAAEFAALEPLAVNVGNFPATQPVTDAALTAAVAAGATEATLAKMRRSLNDVALTALLEREKVEA